MKIAIDCGHGVSPDTGADALLNEDEAVQTIGEKLRDEFLLRDHQVIMCRPSKANSVTDSLNQRCNASNQGGADLYISLHCNVFQATDKPMGTEVFAIGAKGKEIAARVVSQFARLGFKDRGVKQGDHLFVLQYTQAPAILLELCFLDSKPDVELFDRIGVMGIATAIASAILDSAPLNAGKTLGQFIDEGGCSTAAIAGLNKALIAATYGMVSISADCPKIEVSDKAVNLAISADLEPSFWQVVNEYFSKAGKRLKINSLYRTAAQQICLYEWYKRGMCDIGACARPGTSNHEAGQAIDVDDYETAKAIFKEFGWTWQMDKSGNDPVHFEKDLGAGKVTVLALQKYWNQHNPTDHIAEDGNYGDITRSKALQLPIAGY